MLCGLGVPWLRLLWGSGTYCLRIAKVAFFFPSTFQFCFLIYTLYHKKNTLLQKNWIFFHLHILPPHNITHIYCRKQLQDLTIFFVHELHFSPHTFPCSAPVKGVTSSSLGVGGAELGRDLCYPPLTVGRKHPHTRTPTPSMVAPVLLDVLVGRAYPITVSADGGGLSPNIPPEAFHTVRPQKPR